MMEDESVSLKMKIVSVIHEIVHREVSINYVKKRALLGFTASFK